MLFLFYMLLLGFLLCMSMYIKKYTNHCFKMSLFLTTWKFYIKVHRDIGYIPSTFKLTMVVCRRRKYKEHLKNEMTQKKITYWGNFSHFEIIVINKWDHFVRDFSGAHNVDRISGATDGLHTSSDVVHNSLNGGRYQKCAGRGRWYLDFCTIGIHLLGWRKLIK